MKRKFLTIPGLKVQNTTMKLSKQMTTGLSITTFDKKYVSMSALSQKFGHMKGQYLAGKAISLRAGRQSVKITYNPETRPTFGL